MLDRKRSSSILDGKLKCIPGVWSPSQIYLEKICIDQNVVGLVANVNPCRNDGLQLKGFMYFT